MSQRYYVICGYNDPNLKQAFINSVPEYLAQETQRLIVQKQQNLDQLSFGAIFQIMMDALDKMCDQKEFMKQFLDKSSSFQQACKKPDLKLKCYKDKCECGNPRKKHHMAKFRKKSKKFSKFSRKPFRGKRRFFKKKKSSEKSDRCYLCNKKGHFAKECPTRSKKQNQHALQAVQSIFTDEFDSHDLESLVSLDEEYSPDAIFALEEFDDSQAYSSDSDYDSSKSYSDYEQDCLAIQLDDLMTYQPQPVPLIPVTIFSSKFAKPVHLIAFLDTGAHMSILNPKILPEDMWLPHKRNFHTANDGIMTTHIQSKMITLEFFPNVKITTKVLGSAQPRKDAVIGFDIYSFLNRKFRFRIEADGVSCKQYFKPYVAVNSLFLNQPVSQMDEIKKTIG